MVVAAWRGIWETGFRAWDLGRVEEAECGRVVWRKLLTSQDSPAGLMFTTHTFGESIDERLTIFEDTAAFLCVSYAE